MTLKRLPISVAKQVAERNGFDSVIVIGFKAGEGFSGCSYGTTKFNCANTGRTLDEIGEAIELGTISFPGLVPARPSVARRDMFSKPVEESPKPERV